MLFYACLAVAACQLLAQFVLTSINALLEKDKWIFFLSGRISFTPSRILMPIYFIISEETFTPWACIFIDPYEENLFNFRTHSLRFPLSVWIDDAFVISTWYFLAQSRNNGLAWQFGELQFFKSPFRDIFLRHVSPHILPTFKSLSMACLWAFIKWGRRVDCELPLIIVRLICVSTADFDSSLE